MLALRARMQRNLLATLAFSQGVPMLSHGDELGRTQRGNNNAYCHDSPLSWVDWEPDAAGRELLAFTRRVFALRREHPVLRRQGFFTGQPVAGGLAKDLSWLRPDGGEFGRRRLARPRERRQLGMLISGEAHDEPDALGRRAPERLAAAAAQRRRCAPATFSFLADAETGPLRAAAHDRRRRAAAGRPSVLVPARSLALLAFRSGA